jgi:hypothetical protein
MKKILTGVFLFLTLFFTIYFSIKAQVKQTELTSLELSSLNQYLMKLDPLLQATCSSLHADELDLLLRWRLFTDTLKLKYSIERGSTCIDTLTGAFIKCGE